MNHQTTRPHRTENNAIPPNWDIELCKRYLAKVGKTQSQLDYEQQQIRSLANAELLRASGKIHGGQRPKLPLEKLSMKQVAIRQRNHRAKVAREAKEQNATNQTPI